MSEAARIRAAAAARQRAAGDDAAQPPGGIVFADAPARAPASWFGRLGQRRREERRAAWKAWDEANRCDCGLAFTHDHGDTAYVAAVPPAGLEPPPPAAPPAAEEDLGP